MSVKELLASVGRSAAIIYEIRKTRDHLDAAMCELSKLEDTCEGMELRFVAQWASKQIAEVLDRLGDLKIGE